MISIEDRLRDAYRGAAETVRPETVRPFGTRAASVQGPERRGAHFTLRRAMTPLAAAAAVALVAALTAVVPHLIAGTQSDRGSTHRTGAGPAGRFLVTADGPAGTTLSVRNITTGATVAGIVAPERGMVFGGLATGDGRHYVAALWRAGRCRTWFYSFRLSGSGYPSRPAPYALAGIRQLAERIAVSADNTTLAYAGRTCAGNGADLGVFSPRSARSRQWSLPGGSLAGSVSLTRHGTVLAYSIGATTRAQSAVYVLPTESPAGAAITRSTLVAAAARFGTSAQIGSAVITPAGDLVYFTTNRSDDRWQLRAANLATGRLRLTGRYAGSSGSFAADQSEGRIIALIAFPRTSPSPVASPSQSPVPSPSQSPVSTPSRNPTPTASPSRSNHWSPVPSPSGTPTPVPSPSRSRVLSPSRTPTQSPSLSGSAAQALAASRAPTPVPSRSRAQSATPVLSPSRSPVPSPTRVPSPSGSPAPTPSSSPALSPSGSPSPVPSPSPSEHSAPRLAIIDLATGSIRFLPWTVPPGELAIFAW